MRARIGPGEDPVMVCLFVRDVRFFPADAVADPPPQFAPKIVQGKSYDLADPAEAGYFADVLRLTLGAVVELDFSQPRHRSGPVFGDPRLAPYRLGQQSVKAVVLDSYRWRCAISSSTCRNAAPTGSAGSSWSGTSTRSSSRQQRPDQALTRRGSSS
jgi:putative restriction endonuclease